jgi:hypothetical protein
MGRGGCVRPEAITGTSVQYLSKEIPGFGYRPLVESHGEQNGTVFYIRKRDPFVEYPLVSVITERAIDLF